MDESEIIWSSSNEESDSSLGMNTSRHKRCETEIKWSSSDSENDSNSTSPRIRLWSSTQRQIDSEHDLDLFIDEIKKDIRRTNAIKHKITSKKEGFTNSFRKAINKAKADAGFLDYELRAEIIEGTKALITEKEVAYGSCFAKVQLENGSRQFLFLNKHLQNDDNVGKTVVCFLDETNCYTVDGTNVFIQPNKVIRA